jgi:hypothetical protein
VAPQTLFLATLAVLIGLLVGVRRGGTLGNIGNVDARWWPLFLFAVSLVGLSGLDEFSIDIAFIEVGGVGFAILGLLLLVVCAVRNSHLVGIPIVAFGLALNFFAVVANDGVPVDRGALLAAKIESTRTIGQVEIEGSRHLRVPDDRWWWLGDAIPVRELEYVTSFGDLVAIGGLGVTAAHLTRRKKQHHPPPLSADARAGLVSIAAPGIQLDAPIIDLALVAEAASHGYAARPSDTGDEPPNRQASDGDRHDEGETSPRLGDRAEAGSGVGLPVLREP